MSIFAELLHELQSQQEEALAKALPADDGDGDEKIADAAAEGGSQDEPDGDEGKSPKEGDGDGDEGKKPFAKSFAVTLADGTEAEAVDAGELIKSLQDDVAAIKAESKGQVEDLTKALGQTLELVKGQASLIKSLNDRVGKLSSEGRGRKTAVSVHEKPVDANSGSLAKSHASEDASPENFMAKSNAAFDAGKLTGLELSTIDVALRNGQALPPELIRKVVGA